MGWLIVIGVLVLVAIIPLGVSASYNEDGPLVRLILGPGRIVLFPRKKKAPEVTTKVTAKKKPVSQTIEKPAEKKKGGSFTDFLPLVKTAFQFLGDFRRKLRINRLELKIIMAGGDPCDLAIQYGRAWTAVGNLMPRLEQLFVIRKREVEVECDFTSDQTLVIARVDLTITVGRLLYLAFRYGCKVLIQFLNIMKLRKGGAKI